MAYNGFDEKQHNTREDSPSFNDDGGSSRGDSVAPEDGDKKPGSSAAAIRKAQNRIAQREFRLRKQQYIRDLEAKVEILSGDKEERVELMLLLVRNLLQENKELRSLTKSMASFIGDGMGSCLPRLGVTSDQLEGILTRQDTDTAYEAFVALKASKEVATANPGLPVAPPPRKRDSSAAEGTDPKRRRTDSSATSDQVDTKTGPSGTTNTYAEPESATHAAAAALVASGFGSWDFLFPDPSLSAFGVPNANVQNATPWYGVFPPPAANTGVGSAAPNIVSGPQPLAQETTPGSSVSGSGHFGTASPSSTDTKRNLRHSLARMTGSDHLVPPVITTNPNNMSREQVEERRRLQEDLRQSMDGGDDAERKIEALQLITYHLNNYRVNSEYSLPPSLAPTAVQQTVPHLHAIDGVLYPSMRDRMILLQGRFDLVEAMHGYIREFKIHGDDVLDHNSWEPSETWLREFDIICDDEVYAIANKWRLQRGAAPVIRDTDAYTAAMWSAYPAPSVMPSAPANPLGLARGM